MGRRALLGIYCKRCKYETKGEEPIFIKRLADNPLKNRPQYEFKILCGVCHNLKQKVLNDTQIKLLPDEIKNIEVGKEVVNTIQKDGGIIPILPLIGVIAAGITALSTAGGATATAVINAKKAAEEERHHKELESSLRSDSKLPIARGSSIKVEVEEEGLMPENELIDRCICLLQSKGFKIVK
jgi:hypothetical protein